MVDIELKVEELKQKSMKLSFTIANKMMKGLLAECHLVVVAADRHTGKDTQIPKEIIDKLKPFSKQIL